MENSGKLFTEVREMRSRVAHAEAVLTGAVGQVGRRDSMLAWVTVTLSIVTAGLASGSTSAPAWLATVTGIVTAATALVTSYRSDQRDKRLPKLTAALSGFSGVGIDAANRLDMWNLELSRGSFDMAKALEELAALRKRLGDLMSGNAELGLQLNAPAEAPGRTGTGLVRPTRGAAVSDNKNLYIFYPDENWQPRGDSKASAKKVPAKKPLVARRVE